MSSFKFLFVSLTLLLVAVHGESAQIFGTCDNFLTVERTDDGVNYVDITSSLSNYLEEWTKTKSAVLDDVTATTKLRISCQDRINVVAGLIFSVEYGGTYYSTNGGEQNYGYYTLESADSGRTETVAASYPAWYSDLTAAPYNADWTWTCGENADFSGCSAADTEVYVFDFASIACSSSDLDLSCSSDFQELEDTVNRLTGYVAALRARVESLESRKYDTTPAVVMNFSYQNLSTVVIGLLLINLVIFAYFCVCGKRSRKKYLPVQAAYGSE
eukprot:CAMPEP_0202692108 /NCGR_PEP_ID=MMETSP1385-20130828/6579_1 /ASSEMBLY_ACC=CAM_ASM_000861 /TAXON_ID=933848 /ORGANISM="Elphidium margaritaceum" /LENGTH=271 /DNA_ID=CAMNT_0049347585 /DNA_START=16 /DNA_END=831 /DNA_ORIENTATION=-